MHLISTAALAVACGKLTGMLSPLLTGTPAATETTVQRGAASERLAAEYLQARGVRILARNLRCRTGELDLVGLDEGVLAIIEVRQRGRAAFGGALASVTWRKQRKIIRATQFFLQREAKWRGRPMRFDVLAVEGLPGGEHRLVWIKNAFLAG
jgi:putative endonuclease